MFALAIALYITVVAFSAEPPADPSPPAAVVGGQ